jgi:cytochrome c biogenesis protein CcmG, thiol:disulfide interchange protein DsbE
VTSTSPTSSPTLRQRSSIVFAAVVAFVVLTGAAAVLVSRGSKDTSLPATQPVRVTGAPLTPFSAEGLDASIGTAAPTIVGKDFAGHSISLPSKDKRTLIVMVAHWCPHCQREVPRLVEWSNSGAVPKDLDVVLLSTGVAKERGNYPPSSWLKRERSPFSVLADDETSSASTALGLQSFPTMVLVGSDGRVIARTSGEKTVAELEAFATLPAR